MWVLGLISLFLNMNMELYVPCWWKRVIKMCLFRIAVTVCKQINNESSLLPEAALFISLVSSLDLTCRKPCNEHAAPKLFGALCLRWAEPSQTTAPVSSASQTLSIFQFFKLWKVRGMAKQRHGPNRAETQNKLTQVWLSTVSISVYLSESEHGSPVMKSKKGGKN